MFSFRANTPPPSADDATANAAAKPAAPHKFDDLTGGAFSAPTSGERAQKLRTWLTSEPAADVIADVFKELSHRDKGAARVLKDKLDELKRSKNQESIVSEWVDRANTLLGGAKLNVADAMAWQRDAAKAGAPLSKPPLAELRASLAERIKAVEDLQHRLLVQRESAMLLAQRCDVLSTKPLADAVAAREALSADVDHWTVQTAALHADTAWASVDAKYVAQIGAAQSQIVAVWSAFGSALTVAVAASEHIDSPLPEVPVWADELRAKRGQSVRAVASDAPAKPKPAPIDPAERAQAVAEVSAALEALEKEVADGHTKVLPKAVNDLRAVLKTHGRKIDAELDQKAHAVLNQASELGGWQRWRADQIRQELVTKAEALAAPYRTDAPRKDAKKPVKVTVKPALPTAPVEASADEAVPAEAIIDAPVDSEAAEPPVVEATAAEAVAIEDAPEQVVESAPQAQSVAAPVRQGLSGRKMQGALRELRDQWKLTDAGGVPNHSLWRRFDEACTVAHTAVEQWLETVKAEEDTNKAKRFALIDELTAWTAAHANSTDFRAQSRDLFHFAQKWRDGGHVGEKAYDLLQPKWKAAIRAAHGPLDAAQGASIERRKALIAQAQEMAAGTAQHGLRMDFVRHLQQAWQAEAQGMALDRKLEQRMWEQFRSHIDAAFAAKSAQREQINAQMSNRDRRVLEASKALDAANASQDAGAIRAAIDALQQALHAPEPVQTAQPVVEIVVVAPVEAKNDADVADLAANMPLVPDSIDSDATESIAAAIEAIAEPAEPAAPVTPVVVPKPVKAVVARRGDDRPGGAAAAATAPARFGSREGGRDSGRPGDRRGPPGNTGRPSGPPGTGRPSGPPGTTRPADSRDGPRTGDRFGDRRNADRGSDRGSDRGYDRFGGRDEPMAPRLGDAAFRAQREALEVAQNQLRKLAALAHGDAIAGLLAAWEQRKPAELPSAATLGRAINACMRGQWEQAIGRASSGPVDQTLLRLEMAAEVPTPAAYIDARRALQLQMLTKRNDALPVQTWGLDVAKVLQAAHDDESAKRLRTVLKSLLR